MTGDPPPVTGRPRPPDAPPATNENVVDGDRPPEPAGVAPDDEPTRGRTWLAQRAGDVALVVGLFRGVTAFRWFALAWAVAAVASSAGHLERPVSAGIALAAMAAWSMAVASWPRSAPLLPQTAPWVVATELALGATMLVVDGLVYADLSRPISLPWAWPAAGVMVAGILYGARAGLGSALLMMAANLSSDLLLVGHIEAPMRAFSRLGLWAVCGTLAGYVATRLRAAAVEVSLARAREELARELHDGVLQTLAVIQRRSDDRELAGLARDQEQQLRGFLATSIDRPLSLEPELRRLARHHERLYPSQVRVVVAPDCPAVAANRLSALLGAVGESLTNAGKHAGASTITVYVEPADESGRDLFASVKDDGVGFDPAAATAGMGLSGSIRGRMNDVGGKVEVLSRPGRGTEVLLWL